MIIPYGNSILYIDNLNFDSLITSIHDINHTISPVVSYPNPVKNKLNISLKNNGGAQVKVYDLLGKKVKELTFSEETVTLGLADISRGLYLYRINDHKGKLIDKGRFIKE